MYRDLGDVAMRGCLFGCGGLLAPLMRLPFVLSSSATAIWPHVGGDYALIAAMSGSDTHDVHDARQIVG